MRTMIARMGPEEAQAILRAHQRALDGHHDYSVFLFWDGEDLAEAARIATVKAVEDGVRFSGERLDRDYAETLVRSLAA